MKYLIIALMFIAFNAQSQSASFQTLSDKFEGEQKVNSIKMKGLAFKMIVWIAGEREIRRTIGNVKGFCLINIPKAEFQRQRLHINGFKKILADDKFEEAFQVKNNNENVTIYIKDYSRKQQLYFFLVEQGNEVTAFEIKGKIDPKKFLENKLSHKLTNI